MSLNSEHAQLISRIKNAQTIITIVLGLGWLLLLIAIINEGFGGDTFIWFLAVLDGSMYWFFVRRFLDTPDESVLKTLKTIFYSFVVVWIIAVGTSLLIWGEIYIETLVGIVLFLVATFFMNQVNSDGKMYLGSNI